MWRKIRNFFGDWKAFVVVMSFMGIIDSTADGYLDYMVPTLEKQFRLNSSQSGILMASSQVGTLPFIIFAAYIGGRYHLPRLMGVVFLTMGAMNIVMASTRFIIASNQIHFSNHSDDYDFQQFCNISFPASPNTGSSMEVGAYVVFYLAQVIIGITRIPKATTAAAFMEDIIPKRIFPFALGLMMAVENVGDFLGAYIASWTNTIYVTLGHSNLTPDDPAWIGAWWVGFIISGLLYIVGGPILFIFPREFTTAPTTETTPHQPELDADESDESDESDKSNDSNDETSGETVEAYKWKDLPRTIWRLMTNRVYAIFVLVAIFSSFSEDGFGTFKYKYLVYQFSIPEWKATFMTGLGSAIASFVAVIIGGFIVSKLRLNFNKIVLLCLITTVMSITIDIPSMLLHCDLAPLAGFNSTIEGDASLTNTCNDACNCSLAEYTPVCDQGLNYFSACHAGCSGLTNITEKDSKNQIYEGCRCTKSGSAVDGLCPTSCPVWAALFLIYFIPEFIEGLQDSPERTNILRSVERRDKAVALAVLALSEALFSLASPSIAGAVIDTACLVWGKDSSGSRENCWIYRTSDFRLKYMGSMLGSDISVGALFCVAYLLTRKDPTKLKRPGELRDDEVRLIPEVQDDISVEQPII